MSTREMDGVKSKKVLALLLLIEGVLLSSLPLAFAPPEEETETTRIVSLSFVLSLGNLSYNMSFDNTTTEVEILRLESNDTPLQIAAYDLSGIFFELSNVTTLQNLTIVFIHYGPSNISFSRQTMDANVSVLARAYNAVPVSWTFLWSRIMPFGLAIMLGVNSAGLILILPTRHEGESDRSPPPKHRRSTIAAGALLLFLCFTPILFALTQAFDRNWAFVGYLDSTEIALNVHHPQDQIELSPFHGCPVHVSFGHLNEQSVLMSFQNGSTTEKFVVKLGPNNSGSLEIELQNETLITLTRLNVDVTLSLWWISGYMDYGRVPNWSLLLSPFVVVPVSAGFLGAVFVLAAAKRIDSVKRGEQASATEPDS